MQYSQFNFLITQQVGEGKIIFDPTVNTVHAVEGNASKVWDLCHKPATFDEIVAGSGLSPKQVLPALQQLKKMGLIQEQSAGTPPVEIDRREFLLKVAAGVAVAGVTSTLVPMPAAAVSCGTLTENCVSGSGTIGAACNPAACNGVIMKGLQVAAGTATSIVLLDNQLGGVHCMPDPGDLNGSSPTCTGLSAGFTMPSSSNCIAAKTLACATGTSTRYFCADSNGANCVCQWQCTSFPNQALYHGRACCDVPGTCTAQGVGVANCV